MHVKLVVNSFPTASETFLFNLVTGLEARGVTVTVLALDDRGTPELYQHRWHEWSGRIERIPLADNLVKRAASTGVTALRNLGLTGRLVRDHGLRRAPNALLRAHHLMTGDPDIVHFAYSGVAIGFLPAIATLGERRPKLFVSCRGSAEKVKPITEAKRAKELARVFEVVDRVHCVSGDMLEGLVPFGLRRDQAFVNFPSIDVDAFKRTTPYPAGPKDRWQIISTGRLHFQKGYVFALLAMRELVQRGLAFTYHILGDGPDREMLTYVIRQLGLDDVVKLYGRVSGADVKRLLEQADVFLLPSLYEGIANAALEAMAMEVPLVTTTAGGMAEVVEHGRNGMIVDRFDHGALADSLEQLLRSSSLRTEMGARGRETVAQMFLLSNQIDRFLEEYRRAL